MEELTPTLQKQAPGSAPAPKGDVAGEEEFEPVQGRDAATVELTAELEAQVAAKTASDYSHVIWAYGLLWAIFAAYGLVLWRGVQAQSRDAAELAARLTSLEG